MCRSKISSAGSIVTELQVSSLGAASTILQRRSAGDGAPEMVTAREHINNGNTRQAILLPDLYAAVFLVRDMGQETAADKRRRVEDEPAVIR